MNEGSSQKVSRNIEKSELEKRMEHFEEDSFVTKDEALKLIKAWLEEMWLEFPSWDKVEKELCGKNSKPLTEAEKENQVLNIQLVLSQKRNNWYKKWSGRD